MSRIFTVLSVSVLVFGLVSSAFGMNYHVDSTGTKPNDSSNLYYLFFSTPDSGQATKALPATFGTWPNYEDSTLILYNDDATAFNPTGTSWSVAGTKMVEAFSSLTVRSNDPSIRRNLSSSDRTVTVNSVPTFLPMSTIFSINGSSGPSQLIIDESISFVGSTTSAQAQGWVWGQVIRCWAGILYADNVFFSNNQLHSDGVIFSNNGSYNFLNGATFSMNSVSRYGGAVRLEDSYLEASRASFVGNIAGYLPPSYVDPNDGMGGAIFAERSYVIADSATFKENKSAGYGGAITAVDSFLYLKGADFQDNEAGDYGGAVYAYANDGEFCEIVVGANEGTSVGFSGNQAYDGSFFPNSITFGGDSGTAILYVDVDRNAAFNMYDPMWIAGGIAVKIEKTGSGLWSLGGQTQMANDRLGTQIAIAEGTFQLNGGAELDIAHTGKVDRITFASGTTFRVGDAKTPSAVPSLLKTSSLNMAAGTAMVLNDSLRLDISGTDSVIAAAVSGSGALTKIGAGTLTFTGTTDGYSGDVSIEAGTFAIAAGKQFSTTSRFDVSNNASTGAILSVVADAKTPAIVAGMADLSGAFIDVAGVSGSGSGNANDEYVIVKSSTSIIHSPDPSTTPYSTADYLNAAFGFRDVNGVKDAEFVGTIRLKWYNQSPTESSGTFNVLDTKPGVDFAVGVVLSDNTSLSPGQAWNGRDLTKEGNGTLELSENNTYSGKTAVMEGTLLLTHANAAGTGTTTTALDVVDSKGKHVIDVQTNGTLALDFDGTYDRTIAGAGKVLKQGGSTVKLASTENSYTGGTEIQEGVLEFDDSRAFGTGAIEFTGGTLRNTSQNMSATTVTQAAVAQGNSFARFDTPFDLTVSGGITGAGGLAKTGTGTLTLTGTNPYQGETLFKAGTVAISQWNNIGLGELVFDGGNLQNTGADAVLPNNVRLEASGNFLGGAGSSLELTGTISGDGELLQNGDAASTLMLSGVNSYTGGTKINSGTVAIASPESLGSGPVTFGGGTLKNTKEVSGFSNEIQIDPGVKAAFEIDKNDMSIASPIIGNGGLLKTGDATLTLTGNSTYTGDTVVQEGALAVDGRINSFVTVERGAALTGIGTVGRSVTFLDGSIYRWNFNRTEAESPFLHIAGDVLLKNTYFQPVTAGETSTYPIDVNGWTVLTYDGRLLGDGYFLIDDSLCPFIDIALDYDSVGQVKLVAHNRHDPRPLSDVMAASLLMAQRKMNRRPFEQIDNELRHGRSLESVPIQLRNRPTLETARGQSKSVSRNLWGGLVGRTENLASTYFTQDQWRINSWGVQAGYSFLSTNGISLGVTAGAEAPELRNGTDRVEGCDGYLGLYYGQRFCGAWELKGFLGGGLQSYKLYRHDTKYLYRANFHGDSFETNIELARPFLLGNWMLRPYFGFDLEYASQAGAVEFSASREFRSYSGTSLTQMFLKLGMDFEKRLERGDFLFGIGYANMIGGQSVPNVYVYYPFAKKGVTSHGAELGHNVLSLRLGGNRYIDPMRTKSLFVDYTAEIFCDRPGGANRHNFAVGFTSRF